MKLKLGSSFLWLFPLLAGLLLWGLPRLLPPPVINLELGVKGSINPHGEGRNLYSFLGWNSPTLVGDRQARRAESFARFTIPWAFRLGNPLLLEIVASSWGVTDSVHLRANELQLSLPKGGWRRYLIQIPYKASIYEQDLALGWQTKGKLGPLVQKVTLRGASAAGEGESGGWLGLTVLSILALELKRPWGKRFLWLTLLLSSAILGRVCYQPQLLPWEALVALGGFGAILLTRFVPQLTPRFLLWFMLLWLLLAPQILGTWILDDAFISFRYAKNFVAGHGLNFNPGEVVEGYTNFLWTVIIAGLMALGWEPTLAAQILCSGLALATVVLVYLLGEDWWPRQPWSLLPPLFLAVNPAFVLYTARGSGMETALVTFLTLGALGLIGRMRDWRSGGLAGIAAAGVMLTRPDGLLVAVAGGLGFLYQILRAPKKRWAVSTLMSFLGSFLALYGPYFVWRVSYYGYLLPNTFYAKTGATLAQVLRGLSYTKEFFVTLGLPWLGLFLGLSLLGLLRAKGPKQPKVKQLSLWAFSGLTIAYVCGVGGDHFPLGRFFIPMLPPLALLLTQGLVILWEGVTQAGHLRFQKRGIALLSLSFLLLTNVWQLPLSDSRIPDKPIWIEHKVTMKNVDMGRWLRLHSAPNAIVATGIAGALPYYSELFVIDALGLCDLHIAHLEVKTMGEGIAGGEKTDPEYVLSRQPTYIPFADSWVYRQIASFERDYEFSREYGPMGGELRFYRRRGD